MQNSPKDFRAKILGRQGEALTVKYLKKRGYKILKKNYHTPFGEADIVAFKDGVYCFVEVKARTTTVYGLPSEAVTREKQKKYRRIAEFFCLGYGEELPVRFDVASCLDGEIEYVENAFI